MKLHGEIRLNGDGISSTVRSMVLSHEIIGIIKDNIAGYNKVGYQRKVPVVSSFAEFMGPHALSANKDEEVGRIKITKKPLDIVLGTPGYFQVQTENGVKLTRDGRFKLDKEGNLLNLQGHKVLSRDGVPIKFEKIPQSLSDIQVNSDGLVQYKDKDSVKLRDAGYISAVSSDGSRLENINMKQGYIEQSNVVLHEEIYKTLILRRAFSANTEVFKIQNEALTKTIRELGQA